MADPNVQQKIIATNRENLGVDYPMQSKAVQEKSKNTCFIKYSASHFSCTKEWKEKVTITNQQNLGVDYPMQSKAVQEKAQQNYFNETGFLHPLQNPAVQKKSKQKYKYQEIQFSSSIEIAYYIWLTDHKIPFIYQPKPFKYLDNKNKEHLYFPDFYLINTREYIELKGDNHFKDGKLVDISCTDKNYIAEAKMECMKKNNVKIILYSDMFDILKYCQTKFGSTTWYRKYKN